MFIEELLPGYYCIDIINNDDEERSEYENDGDEDMNFDEKYDNNSEDDD